jgi:hypothetical protein
MPKRRPTRGQARRDAPAERCPWHVVRPQVRLRIARWWHCEHDTSRDGTPLARMLPRHPNASQKVRFLLHRGRRSIHGPSLHLPQCSIIPALGVIAAMEGGATSCERGPLFIPRFWARQSALAGSAVQRMIVANGSSRSDTSSRTNRRVGRSVKNYSTSESGHNVSNTMVSVQLNRRPVGHSIRLPDLPADTSQHRRC